MGGVRGAHVGTSSIAAEQRGAGRVGGRWQSCLGGSGQCGAKVRARAGRRAGLGRACCCWL
eukprot:7070137-Prymnesium_polylepis.2